MTLSGGFANRCKPLAPPGSRAEAGRDLVGQGIDPVCGRRSYQQKPAAAGSPIDEVDTLAAFNLALALSAGLGHDAKLDWSVLVTCVEQLGNLVALKAQELGALQRKPFERYHRLRKIEIERLPYLDELRLLFCLIDLDCRH